MTDDGPERRESYRDRPWGRAIGILLMFPIGLILLLVVIFFFGGRASFGTGWWFVLVVIFFFLLIFRISYRRSRRRYWMQHHQDQNEPMRILQERYARGEITKERFDQMSRDLQQRRYP
jgi:small-conductance mechanosensitive channel